ncbi:MAG: radical SAM protein [Anaerofustis sp.]
MNEYEPIYRPPSEADSWILKVTGGCSHNQCTFCGTYKGRQFYVRDWEEIFHDIRQVQEAGYQFKRVYLSDSDALATGMELIEKTLKEIKNRFPSVRRVGLHATAIDVLEYTPAELEKLHSLGLGIIYIGAESGNSEILRRIRKGAGALQIIESVKRTKEAGILSSVTFISGLGGKELWKEHACDTANMINEMQPDYASLLTLLIDRNAPLSESVEDGSFQILTAQEVLNETKLMLEQVNLKTPCVFRSNHASNYLALKGTLPQDRDALIHQIETAKLLKPDAYRAL